MTREIDPTLADSHAARMLSDGLARASQERGLSLRKIAASLGYKQAVVLSHMATGRAPIPIDRAAELADALDIDRRTFVLAVLAQRHPTVDWHEIARPSDLDPRDVRLVEELEAILGHPVSELESEHRMVFREVASDRAPARRWLSVHELPLVEAMRERLRSTDEMLTDAERDEILDELAKRTPEGFE
jgi:cyanate lyase